MVEFQTSYFFPLFLGPTDRCQDKPLRGFDEEPKTGKSFWNDMGLASSKKIGHQVFFFNEFQHVSILHFKFTSF